MNLMVSVSLCIVLLMIPSSQSINLRKSSKELTVNGHFFEGDSEASDVPENFDTSVRNDGKRIVKRSLMVQYLGYLWIDRIVPYEIPPEMGPAESNIKKAMEKIAGKSCIKFVKRRDEKHWIKFVDNGGCSSSRGRQFLWPGPQTLSLSKICQKNVGKIVHELMHALGFWHEQSRLDRDDHVEIMWENIEEGKEKNFERVDPNLSQTLQSNYDINSIMHYGPYAFNKNPRRPTIMALNRHHKEFGNKDDLSTEDARYLNLLYRCKEEDKIYTSWSEWSKCSPKKNSCQRYRQRFCSNYNKKKCPEANEYDGIHVESDDCSRSECYPPIDGHWNKWSSWTECKKCGRGAQTRSRVCDDPKPERGGKKCNGSKKEKKGCFIKPCKLGLNNCQFDSKKMCIWKDVSKKSFIWKINKGKTATPGTGPEGDHTTGQSYYLYTESSQMKPGMRAVLESKTFYPKFSRCMLFFYHMKGNGIGSLRVYIAESNVHKILWEKHGDQGPEWKYGNVQLSAVKPYKVRIEAERGSGDVANYGDIGLDDIYFYKGDCVDESVRSIF